MLFKRKCTITFIAHGSTLYTEENRICDKESHPPLNEQGQEEAELIANWIVRRSPNIDKIYFVLPFSIWLIRNILPKNILFSKQKTIK